MVVPVAVVAWVEDQVDLETLEDKVVVDMVDLLQAHGAAATATTGAAITAALEVVTLLTTVTSPKALPGGSVEDQSLTFFLF